MELDGTIVRKEVKPETIQQILSRYDLSKADASIVYDPLQTVAPFHFISIGKSRDNVTDAIDFICDLVMARCFPYGRAHYVGSNGLHGELHYITKDFREKIKNSTQNKFNYIPIEGIVSEEIDKHSAWRSLIKDDVFKMCIEFSKL